MGKATKKLYCYVDETGQVSVKKVRGMRDESHALLRLADAVCGFARDYLEGESYTKEFIWVFERSIIKKV